MHSSNWPVALPKHTLACVIQVAAFQHSVPDCVKKGYSEMHLYSLVAIRKEYQELQAHPHAHTHTNTHTHTYTNLHTHIHTCTNLHTHIYTHTHTHTYTHTHRKHKTKPCETCERSILFTIQFFPLKHEEEDKMMFLPVH